MMMSTFRTLTSNSLRLRSSLRPCLYSTLTVPQSQQPSKIETPASSSSAASSNNNPLLNTTSAPIDRRIAPFEGGAQGIDVKHATVHRSPVGNESFDASVTNGKTFKLF